MLFQILGWNDIYLCLANIYKNLKHFLSIYFDGSINTLTSTIDFYLFIIYNLNVYKHFSNMKTKPNSSRDQDRDWDRDRD